MKKAPIYALFLAVLFSSSAAFSFQAAPEITILSQGYPTAIYYNVYFTQEKETVEVIAADLTEIVGTTTTSPDDPTLRIFKPTTPMALGPVEVTVAITDLSVTETVQIVDRADDRGFSYTATPDVVETVLDRRCCDDECVNATEFQPAVEVAVETNAPLRVEGRLTADGQISSTRVVNVSGMFSFTLLSDIIGDDTEYCLTILATDFDGDEALQSEEQCWRGSEFGEIGEGTTIPEEIVACSEQQNGPSDGEKSDAGCCATRSSKSPAALLLVLAMFWVGRRRKSSRI